MGFRAWHVKGETTNPTKQFRLQAHLDNFEDLFVEPHWLPPKQEKEHRIMLKDGGANINLHPCWYPPPQKSEIE
ncbi:hypothetical protein KSP39_PZI023721 [Platanthera zijinensis]|uniref:Uncharacterized protein n=1 Tax=Platanthera zijinensis TaxID=2320716 RepID=A0AAP0FTU2_9ASPA